jgi:hypothetical protein
MELSLDQDVQAVLEFMQSQIPAEKLVSVARAVSGLSDTLWGHYSPKGVVALALSAEPIR